MFIAPPSDCADTDRLDKSSADAERFVMHLTKACAWRLDVFGAFAALRNPLSQQSTSSKRDLAVLVCSTAAELGDSYRSLAWGRTLDREAGPAGAAVVGFGRAVASA